MSTARVGTSDLMEFELYFDYLCPYVYRASRLLTTVAPERDLDVRWRYFSLTQVNSTQPGWTVWDAPAADKARGRLAFKAAEAARRQDRFDTFHAALLQARHADRQDIDDLMVVEQVAIDAGLDLERLRRDLADPTIIQALARDHQHAVVTHGVFGTPTFVFPNGASAYIRLGGTPGGAEAVRVFDSLVAVAAGEPGILEIKRPNRPLSD